MGDPVQLGFVQFEPHQTVDMEHQIFSPDTFEDSESLDASSVMDQGIMTPSTMERKGSVATDSETYFTPSNAGNAWDDHLGQPLPASTITDGQTMPQSFAGSHFMSNNPFRQHLESQWLQGVVYETPDSTAMTTSGYPQQYIDTADGNAQAIYNSNPFVSNGPPPPMMKAQMSPATMVPQSTNGLLTAHPMALAEQDSESRRRNNNRSRDRSPPRAISPAGFLRREGVRKKSHKVDIPLGRNLLTIDQLILESNNDDEIKELKQQKRLLRNRQAALDSRQRKKKHTEELEVEKKTWEDERSLYQQQIDELQEKLSALAVAHEQLAVQNEELTQQVENVQSEKEQIIMAHTEETSNLRGKINALRAVQSPMRPAPITTWQPGFDHMEMPPDDVWNTFTSINDMYENDEDEFMDDSSYIPRPQRDLRPVAQPARSSETTLVVGRPRKDVNSVADSLGITTGAVLLFLLYGAYLGSSTSSSNRLPPIPDQYRSEANKVLDDVFGKGATGGLATGQPQVQIFDVRHSISNAWTQPMDATNNYQNKLLNHQSAGFLSGMPAPDPTSSLDSLTTHLLTPSREQEIEAAFTLTPTKYNHVTMSDIVHDTNDNDDDDDDEDDDACSTPVPNYQLDYRETFKRARADPDDESVPLIYKRSLMWEKVHPDVLKQFRTLIRDNPISSKTRQADTSNGARSTTTNGRTTTNDNE